MRGVGVGMQGREVGCAPLHLRREERWRRVDEYFCRGLGNGLWVLRSY